MIELLKELIRIDSVSGNESRIAAFLAGWIERAFSIAPTVIDRNVILDIRGPEFHDSKGTSVLFCSHIDTVPPSTGWTKDPFGAEQSGEMIYGLGANDALASVVSMIEGAIRGRNSLRKGRLVLAFVCEEEKGDKGFASVERSLPRYTYGVFGEPTGLSLGYCMRGSMKLKMISRGKSCHASRPEEGENAIFNLARDLEKIRSLPLSDHSPWGRATVEPTVVHGGQAENQIPDRVETVLDIRTTIEKNNDYILELLARSGISFEVLRNLRKPVFCDTNSGFIRAIQEALPGVSFYPFGGSCDMAFTKAPSVVFGPGTSERSHSADEYITVSELEAGAQAYASIIGRLLG